jgi:hypothetical protein
MVTLGLWACAGAGKASPWVRFLLCPTFREDWAKVLIAEKGWMPKEGVCQCFAIKSVTNEKWVAAQQGISY